MTLTSTWTADVALGLVGPFRLVRRLGRGASGEVWLAERADAFEGHSVLRRVALKVKVAEDDEVDVTELLREWMLGTAVEHRNVIRVLDVGRWRGHMWYLVLEFVDGLTLGQISRKLLERRARIPDVPLLEIALGTCRGLRAIHEARSGDGRPLRLIHRDVKPSNVIVARDGEVKVLDFGIVRSEVAPDRTQTGIVKGTPRYMAPEQYVCAGADLTPAADIFAFGAMLYELATREVLFDGSDIIEVLDQKRSGEALERVYAAPGLPKRLQPVLARCLEVSPQQRYPSAAELEDELQRVLQTLPRDPDLAALMKALCEGDLPPGTWQDPAWRALERSLEEPIWPPELIAEVEADSSELQDDRADDPPSLATLEPPPVEALVVAVTPSAPSVPRSEPLPPLVPHPAPTRTPPPRLLADKTYPRAVPSPQGRSDTWVRVGLALGVLVALVLASCVALFALHTSRTEDDQAVVPPAPERASDSEPPSDATALVPAPPAEEAAGNMVGLAIVERCNGLDDDGDGVIPPDERDGDGDGAVPCSPWVGGAIGGRTLSGGDCDDAEKGRRPRAAERPGDGVDQDCDGRERCLQDSDGDGIGGDKVVLADVDGRCVASGLSASDGDCDDQLASVHPGASELPNGRDDDCDGEADEEVAPPPPIGPTSVVPTSVSGKITRGVAQVSFSVQDFNCDYISVSWKSNHEDDYNAANRITAKVRPTGAYEASFKTDLKELDVHAGCCKVGQGCVPLKGMSKDAPVRIP